MLPTQGNERIDILDILRGFALLGIIFVNIPMLLTLAQPSTFQNTAYYYGLQMFVEGKFFTIFSFLFGIGFYIFLSRASLKMEHPYRLFARRLIILFAFGVFHFLFQPGEALSIYAIFGLILMFTFKLPRHVNLIIALVAYCAITILGAKVLVPFALILLGLAAGQYHVFQDTSKNRKTWIVFTVIMGIVSCIGWYYQKIQLPQLTYFENVATNSNAEIAKYLLMGNLSLWLAPFISSFYVGCLVLLTHTRIGHMILYPLRNFGRMALTVYISQTMIILLLGLIFNWKGNITFIGSGLVSLGILVFLIVFSNIWFKFYKFGPLEWLWRVITYGKLTSNKR